MSAKNLALTGIRSPDSTARSESQYRPRYAGSSKWLPPTWFKWRTKFWYTLSQAAVFLNGRGGGCYKMRLFSWAHRRSIDADCGMMDTFLISICTLIPILRPPTTIKIRRNYSDTPCIVSYRQRQQPITVRVAGNCVTFLHDEYWEWIVQDLYTGRSWNMRPYWRHVFYGTKQRRNFIQPRVPQHFAYVICLLEILEYEKDSIIFSSTRRPFRAGVRTVGTCTVSIWKWQ